jgi:aminoglycoside phosphotransferase (APT) family kinase protein
MHATGLQEDAVSQWLAGNVEDSVAPHRFTAISGGHSNLTYLVVDARGRRSVLRRPPLGPTLPSAHDMGREYRIISALWRAGFPVPPPRGYCDDADVTRAPFTVTAFIHGLILRDTEAARVIAPVSEGVFAHDVDRIGAQVRAVAEAALAATEGQSR